MTKDMKLLKKQCQRIDQIFDENDQILQRIDKKLRQLQIDYAVFEIQTQALKEGFRRFKIETTFYDPPLEIKLEEEVEIEKDWDDLLTAEDYETELYGL